MLTLGVIADTHIPDRTRRLHPGALETFRKANLEAILHAGDISVPRVIRQLEEIAPVHAVRGNRDILLPQLPYHLRLQFEEVVIGMTHSHGNWSNYLREKILYLIKGPTKFSYFEEKAVSIFPDTNAIIFGHSHAPVNKRVGDQLLFNPGSPTIFNEYSPNPRRSVGLLHINGNQVEGEIIPLDN